MLGLTYARHDKVMHPAELGELGWNDRVFEWITNHIGASVPMFWLAFFVPLAVLPMSGAVKLSVAVISGSWYQWWMLTAIQRSGMRADKLRAQKADADHLALTHIANTVDAIAARR